VSKLQTRWDNSKFFLSSDDPALGQTIETLRSEIEQLNTACQPFAEYILPDKQPLSKDYSSIVSKLADVYQQQEAIGNKLGNASMFLGSCLSVNARDAAAATLRPTLQQLGAALRNSVHSLWGFLARADETMIEAVLQHEKLADLEFHITQLRATSDQLLPIEQEQLLTGIATTGLHGWGNLYQNLAGTLQCTVANETVGLAQAANLLSDHNRDTRKHAWQAINHAWSEQEQSVAAILNNINGWRIEERQKRSAIRSRHYLDTSCHNSKISRDTLDALMQTTYEHRHMPQQAMQLMAEALKTDRLAPWDLMAPAPVKSSNEIPFEQAIALIAESFSEFSPAMGDYAIEMAEKGWIDCDPTDNRSTGAYCGGFSDPREARIFITYSGTSTNVITLAHELGHAWHNRVMEKLPKSKIGYPMTLAETASTFAETLVRESLMKNATNDKQKLEILWSEAAAATTFMLNIPARFDFEKQLVDARNDKFLTPDTLRKMMVSSWQHWYEDSLSEYDDMFWASKLHFSISGFGFYNYPYLFGYLFSLGIYAQREKYSNAFEPLYREILLDTGNMTAEDLVQKHLQQDITQANFWADSIAVVNSSLQQFESLVKKTTATDATNRAIPL